MRFTEDNLKTFARAYARTTYSQPLLLPMFLRGDARANALAVSDFLRWRADQHDAALTTHVKLWPELFALCQKSNKADDDRDGGGSTSGEHASTTAASSTIDDVTNQNTHSETGTNDATTTDDSCDDNNAKNVLQWVDDDDITEQLTLADALGLHESNNLETWLSQLRDNRKKPLQCATHSQAVELQKLITEYPNLAEAGRIVAGAVMLQAEKQLPVRLPRLLLQGEPGCGKTEFVRTIAETLSLPLIFITLSATCGEFELPGGHRTWRSATPGRLFQGLLKSSVANPLFLFDEAERGRKIAQSALLAWLEDTHFRDQFLDISFRSDQVNSVLITNSLETLDIRTVLGDASASTSIQKFSERYERPGSR